MDTLHCEAARALLNKILWLLLYSAPVDTQPEHTLLVYKYNTISIHTTFTISISSWRSFSSKVFSPRDLGRFLLILLLPLSWEFWAQSLLWATTLYVYGFLWGTRRSFPHHTITALNYTLWNLSRIVKDIFVPESKVRLSQKDHCSKNSL